MQFVTRRRVDIWVREIVTSVFSFERALDKFLTLLCVFRRRNIPIFLYIINRFRRRRRHVKNREGERGGGAGLF